MANSFRPNFQGEGEPEFFTLSFLFLLRSLSYGNTLNCEYKKQDTCPTT